MRWFVALAFLVIGGAGVASAEEIPRVDPPLSPRGRYDSEAPSGFLPLDPFRLSLGLASGAAWLNAAPAAAHHFGTVGPNFYVTVGMAIYDVVAVTTSFGAAFPHDHASFSEDVVPLIGSGSPMSAESTLQITNYSVAIGPRTPFFVLGAKENGVVAAALFADYGWSRIHGDRFIDNCNDCTSQSLELADGAFWRVGGEIGAVSLNGGKNGAVTLSVSYQRYEALAGFKQELRVGFVLWFL